jgi:Alginate lyase.
MKTTIFPPLPPLAPAARASLTAAADAIHAAPLLSVTDKTELPPSNDPHDYLGIAPYWWRDPDAPDGLPWIRRDGETNPSFFHYDNIRLSDFYQQIATLAFAAETLQSDRHAASAGLRLRRWFLDPATRMNPNLNHAQFIPGRCDGRGIGIIDTAALVFLLDSVSRLPFTADWTPSHHRVLQDWFAAYLDWLLQSQHGRDECAERNNHGTWYDAQVVAFALFCDRPEIAAHQLCAYTTARLATHIAPDGSMPQELSRTLSFNYCCFNLTAFQILATLAPHAATDLRAGGAIQRAADWLLPYLSGTLPWQWRQIEPPNSSLQSLAALLSGRADIAAKYEPCAWQSRIYRRRI